MINAEIIEIIESICYVYMEFTTNTKNTTKYVKVKQQNFIFVTFDVKKKNVLCVEILRHITIKLKKTTQEQMNNKRHYFKCQIFI